MNAPVLVGQPFAIASYMVIPVLKCNCERGGIVQLMAQAREGGWIRTQEACPSCHKIYQIAAINVDAHGQIQFAIEMLKKTEDAPSELVLQ